jgi:lysyl-tRNA synthetase class 2
MLEVYQAYADYEAMMELTEELITSLAKSLFGREKFNYQGREIDLKRPWKREKFTELMEEKFKINLEDATREKIIEELKRRGFEREKLEKGLSRTKLLKILAENIAPEAPTFVIDHLSSFCPLAKTHKDNKNLSQRFELFIGGLEIANAYSELNDPLEQKERFQRQWEELETEEKKEKKIDEDFVLALEYGMPPAGGLGIGIDRLVMLLTDSPTIREVIFFPQLKEIVKIQ